MMTMWTLTPDDLRSAKDSLVQHRIAIEARHAGELKALEMGHAEELRAIDAELAEISAMEQAADAFARKYKVNSPLEERDQEELRTKLTTPAKMPMSTGNWGDALFTPAASIVHPAP
jgi:hypothetical protein